MPTSSGSRSCAAPDDAVTLLEQIAAEVERRQDLIFGARQVRVEMYNQTHRPALPYLVYIIDEIAIITQPAQERGAGDAEKRLSERFNAILIQKTQIARALGVYFVGATQKPSSDVIRTSWRDICPWKVAYHCSTNIASRAVLDSGEAADLPNEPGIALFKRGSELRQLRTYYAGLDEGAFIHFCDAAPRASAHITSITTALSDASNVLPDPVPGATEALPEVRYHHSTANQGGLIQKARQALPDTLDDAAGLTPEQRRIIWAVLQTTRRGDDLYSISAVQHRLWPHLQRGGQKFTILDATIRTEAAKRKLAVEPVPGRGIRLVKN